VKATDPHDREKLIADIHAHRTERVIRAVLSRSDESPQITPEAFLKLLECKPPRSIETRVELFKRWLRCEPKPRGGKINDLNIDDEFPVLHWILRENANDVFSAADVDDLDGLREFIVWVLRKGRHYAEYFDGTYRWSSFNMYTSGCPRFQLCAKLAREIENGAIAIGIDVPDAVRLPAMPHIGMGGGAFMIIE
jgi:hypothetical protein